MASTTSPSSSAVANLQTPSLPRLYMVSVYAVVLVALALFGVFSAAWGLSQGDRFTALTAIGSIVLLLTTAGAMWTLHPRRYTVAYILHGAGLILALVIFVGWVGHVLAVINNDPRVVEAGGDLAVVIEYLPAFEINPLPLADALLIALINLALLLGLRSLRREERDFAVTQATQTRGEEFLRRMSGNTSARIGGTIIVILLLITYIMPRVDPYYGLIVLRDGDLSRRLDPPECFIGWLRVQQGLDTWEREGPAPASPFAFPCDHPFGFDKNGRDLMRRVLHGISVSLAVSLITVTISLTIGTVIGLTAGYLGGAYDSVLMRMMDVMLAFPALLLAISIVAVRGPGLVNAMVAIGIVGIPGYARLSRSMALSIREQEFVMAARGIGAGELHTMLRYVLPNSLAPLIVQSTLALGTAVIETAALGFLGLGQQPPYPELGKMLADSQEVITSGRWWVMLFPGLTVMMIVLGFNLMGDALRDALDPKLRGR